MVFALISAFLFTAIAYLIRKRITYVEMYTTSLFSIVFQLIVDMILEFKYNYYGYFEYGVDYLTFIVIFLIYPPLNIIYLNYFPLENSHWKKLLYIILWCAFSIGYEYLSVRYGFFYYENWKLWYSAIIYPFVYLIITLNFLLTKKLLSHYRNTNK
ncbi:CBO0543 family protein [Ornithinibacillus scapharcae]|uniref:CBO0543 family protein n=1 Tax=Ornithinibacillus scapharcae TaxID=1147159 RepID=UPI000225B6AB|nr:CBO0543 family protein [Ornithinibacillus scapharcae]